MAKILTGSDCSLDVEFGSEISEEIFREVRAFQMAVENAHIPGVTEVMPTYRSAAVMYRPEEITAARLKRKLNELLRDLRTGSDEEEETLRVPVLYGGAYGPDLRHVAEVNGLDEAEVIRRHTSRSYLVYMVTPTFFYLGSVEDGIATPRLSAPRVAIPAGSVGIAGSQTGIYPISHPGGWQLIGRTPAKLYDASRENPLSVTAGMRVEFYAVDEKEYGEILAREYPEGYPEAEI